MRKIRIFTVLIILVSLALGACSTNKSADCAYDSSGYYETSASAPSVEYGYDSDSYTKENIDSVSAEQPDAVATEGRKLIKYVTLYAETLNFDESLTEISKKTAALGGYIQSSNISNNDYYYYSNSNYRISRNAHYTIRIPGDKLDALVEAIGTIGNITSKEMTTEDVTLNYLDVEARTKSLRLQQERLLALLEKAETVEEIIALEERISEVTYQLESNESMLNNLDNLVTYSTVDIYLNEVDHVTVVDPDTVGERISSGLSDTFYSISEGFKDFIVWFVVALPFILIWGVIIGIAVFIAICIIKKIKKNQVKTVTPAPVVYTVNTEVKPQDQNDIKQ